MNKLEASNFFANLRNKILWDNALGADVIWNNICESDNDNLTDEQILSITNLDKVSKQIQHDLGFQNLLESYYQNKEIMEDLFEDWRVLPHDSNQMKEKRILFLKYRSKVKDLANQGYEMVAILAIANGYLPSNME